MKDRIVILGAGAMGGHIAALLAAVADVEVVEPHSERCRLRWDHEYPTLPTAARHPEVFTKPPKEKAQWKRERQGR